MIGRVKVWISEHPFRTVFISALVGLAVGAVLATVA